MRPRVTLRLWVVLSLLMALSAVASGLFLLVLARPFVKELTSQQAQRAAILLFTGAAVGGAIAAVTGLAVGLRFAGRIRGIIEKTQALSGMLPEPPRDKALDEIGVLDDAVGRLTLSIDRFVRDSDILSRLPEGMLLLGPDGGLLSFNATAETLLDLMAPERFRGEPILSASGLFPVADGNEALADLLEQAQGGERTVERGEIAVTTAIGHHLLLEVTVQRREVAGGAPFLVVLFRDADEKRRIRDEIRRADQLAFLGGMAARVAHEIRTPLATVRGLVELLEADLGPDDARRSYIERILVGMDRQDRLVEDLLTLSHPEPESWQPVSVFALVSELGEVFPSETRLELALPTEVPPILGDPMRLNEVLANLVRNALEATPANGLVQVRAEPVGDDTVRLAVRNTGAGIAPELRDKIFQPFFTTKPRGTGLGLAIARQIVEAHRGRIRLESDGHTVTTFIIELPAAPALATRSERWPIGS